MNKPKAKKILLVVFLVGLVGSGIGWGIFEYMKDRYAYIVKPIPNPFLFENGTQVSSMAQWDARRVEMMEMIETIEYGHLPGRPDAIKVTQISQQNLVNQSTLTRLVFTIIAHNSTPQTAFNLSVWLFIPVGNGPFPVVLKVGRDGRNLKGFANGTILERGYVYICYNHTELDEDTEGYDVVGPAQAAYSDFDWGTIAVWAWGAMRVMDYLKREPWVDASFFPNVINDKILVTGHSRAGKTALLAAAMDTRFAMTVPSGSGCAGAGSFLIQGVGAETIALITMKITYKAWLQINFSRYAWHEADLLFDQHFLRALIAPRIILSMDGGDDFWANPIGTQAMYEAADPVFEFLGVKQNNAIHYRDGGHGYYLYDVEDVLDFADQRFLNKTVVGADDFYMTPYDQSFPIHYGVPN